MQLVKSLPCHEALYPLRERLRIRAEPGYALQVTEIGAVLENEYRVTKLKQHRGEDGVGDLEIVELRGECQ